MAIIGTTTSRMRRMRRRSASRTPASGAVRDFAGCKLGASLRTGSAIAPLVRSAGARRGPVRNRVAQIFFDDGELRDDLLDGLAWHAGKRCLHHLFAELAELLEHRPRG